MVCRRRLCARGLAGLRAKVVSPRGYHVGLGADLGGVMYNYSYPIHGTVLTGLPVATVQAWLTAAQTALQALMTGQKVVTASYGDKSVSYTPADMGALVQWIHLLQRA